MHGISVHVYNPCANPTSSFFSVPVFQMVLKFYRVPTMIIGFQPSYLLGRFLSMLSRVGLSGAIESSRRELGMKS